MAYLECTNTNTNKTIYVAIKKPIISIGSKSGNDLLLTTGEISPTHASIVRRGDSFLINLLDKKRPFQINGRSFRSAPLRFGDILELSHFQITLKKGDLPTTVVGSDKDLQNLEALVQFSSELMTESTPQILFSKLLHSIVELTQAEKGFVIILQEDNRHMAASHNVSREAETLGFSDTIVNTVVETREPIIINNALRDSNYSSAKSVIDLRLSSVMCVPLIFRNELLGVIYLGNDAITGLFTNEDLKILKIWAAQASVIVHTALFLNELKTTNKTLRAQLKKSGQGSIIGSSNDMQVLFKHIKKLAPTDLSVLVLGETGTGKELVANELHKQSDRTDKPFISINCGAIPENLLESELFGHKKGAFTGAHSDKIGKFEAANGGTIFLDEIGEMPMNLQVKLLRVLQERSIERVGDIKPRPIDIRIVSATNKDLNEEITNGNFREDLFYRLNEVTFNLPPLRDRGSDIHELAKYFLNKYTEQYNSSVKGFTNTTVQAMTGYYWPGNIRQLESRIKRAVIMCETSLLTPDDVGIKDSDKRALRPLDEVTEEFKLSYIRDALEINNWNKAQTARDLEVDPRTVFRYIEKFQDL
jgi:transcriptional regulator with GAF, ATPase, and Fis domain